MDVGGAPNKVGPISQLQEEDNLPFEDKMAGPNSTVL